MHAGTPEWQRRVHHPDMRKNLRIALRNALRLCVGLAATEVIGAAAYALGIFDAQASTGMLLLPGLPFTAAVFAGPVIAFRSFEDFDQERAEMVTPWELTISRTGQDHYLLATQMVPLGVEATIDFHRSTTYVDIPEGTTDYQVRDILEACVGLGSLGCDVEALADLDNREFSPNGQLQTIYHYVSPQGDMSPQEDAERARKNREGLERDLTHAHKDLREYVGTNTRLTATELLELGHLAWALPEARAREKEALETQAAFRRQVEAATNPPGHRLRPRH